MTMFHRLPFGACWFWYDGGLSILIHYYCFFFFLVLAVWWRIMVVVTCPFFFDCWKFCPISILQIFLVIFTVWHHKQWAVCGCFSSFDRVSSQLMNLILMKPVRDGTIFACYCIERVFGASIDWARNTTV